MPSILRACPRPVPLAMGGGTYFASEIRVGDLADLQVYVAQKSGPSPYDEFEPILIAKGGGRAWKTILADTIDRQQEWPPDLTSDEATEILSDADGLAYFAWVILRRHNPGLAFDAMPGLISRTTSAEYRRLSRIAWATDPMEIMTRMVDGPSGEKAGRPRDWAMAWYRYATTCRNGPKFEDLTLSQLAIFVSEGEIPEPGMLSGPAHTIDFGVIARRREFWAEIDRTDDIGAEVIR